VTWGDVEGDDVDVAPAGFGPAPDTVLEEDIDVAPEGFGGFEESITPKQKRVRV
jgi:hypothetical protein